MKIDAPRIKSWVERIERLLEERVAINGDIKDIYTEIKKGDHDAKAIRKLIQRRAQDEGDLAEQDALLAAYTDAVAGKIKALEAIERGASTKEAAKAGGISTGAVSALVSVQKSRSVNATHTPPHDSETGEIDEQRILPEPDGAGGTRSGAAAVEALPCGQEGLGDSPPEAPRQETPPVDDLSIPEFLRAKKVEVASSLRSSAADPVSRSAQ